MSVHVCRECGGPADLRCESREVGERQVVRKHGTERVVQPYRDYHLCATCAPVVVAGSDPPRSVEPLPHYKPPTRAAAAAEQPRLGEDWGRR